MKIHNSIILASLLILAATMQACSSDDSPSANANNYPEPITLSVDEHTELQSSFGVSYDIMDKLASTYSDNNFVASPLSLTYALAMSANLLEEEQRSEIVAKLMPDGESLESLNSTMEKLSGTISHNCNKSKLALANSLWANDISAVSNDILNTLQKYYSASCNSAQLATEQGARTINSWISDHTFNLINDFYYPTPEIEFLLLNATYYAGDWLDRFNDPVNGYFTNIDQNVTTTLTMKGTQNINYSINEVGQYISWKFHNSNICFKVFIPYEKYSLDGVTFDMLDTQNYEKIISGKSMISIPEFKLSSKQSLKDNLKLIGLSKLFDGIYNIHISDIIQQTVIDVNHKGAEAAAVTSTEMIGADITPTTVPEEIRIDHPFIFEINAYGCPLIAGRVTSL